MTGLIQTGIVLTAVHHYRVPRAVAARMAANVLLDTTLGAIPFVGDAFDAVFKANTRNIKLLGQVRDLRKAGKPVPTGASVRYLIGIGVRPGRDARPGPRRPGHRGRLAVPRALPLNSSPGVAAVPSLAEVTIGVEEEFQIVDPATRAAPSEGRADPAGGAGAGRRRGDQRAVPLADRGRDARSAGPWPRSGPSSSGSAGR